MASGIELIAAERERQKSVEGWDSKHDAEHCGGQLAIAAACYAAGSTGRDKIYRQRNLANGSVCFEELWPWDKVWDKRKKHDQKRQLAIAGALIAAELDRLGED